VSEFYSDISQVILNITEKNFESDEIITELVDFLDRLSLNRSEGSTSSDHAKKILDSYMSKDFGFFLDKFAKIPKQITDLRSNFVPIEILNSNYTNQTLGAGDISGDSTNVPDNLSFKESYENAFMRILGMPESSDIKDDEEIFVITKDFTINKIKFGLLKSQNPSESSADGLDILDERQRNIRDRIVLLSEEFYSRKSIINSLQETPKDTTSTGVGTSLTQKIKISAKDISDNPNNFGKICYLKCLPVQDSRFLRCISESGKIVSKPFDDRMIKIVNKEKIKTSFLENLIRMRLDRISGRIYGDDQSFDSDGKQSGTFASENGIGEFSILEQLLLEKLAIMLDAQGEKYYELLKKIIDVAKIEIKNDNKASERPSLPGDGDKKAVDEGNIDDLKLALEIQEAILYVLKDTNVSSYLYELNSSQTKSNKTLEGYIRNSSGFDDPISNSLISIIESEASIYRDLINEKISSTGSTGSEDGEPAPDYGKSDGAISPISGDDHNPIGIVDIIVYALALFSLDETSLFNLLNQKQKENLAKTLSKDANANSLFSSLDLNLTSPVESINKLTIAIYTYYSFFIKSMGQKDLSDISAVSDESEGIILDSSGDS
jgi:hypothetical protein